MILTNEILTKSIKHKNINLLIHGSKQLLIDSLNYKQMKSSEKYVHYENTYLIDISTFKNKSDSVDVVYELSRTVDYYSGDVVKKVICILNFDKLNHIYQKSIKHIIQSTFESGYYMIHCENINSIEPTIKTHFMLFYSPREPKKDITDEIVYKKIIKLLKKDKITKHTISSIREICYMYYMNHRECTSLLQLIVKNVGDNLYIPNCIKINLVSELTDVNKMYQNSYRKPIFLEYAIVCLFKHLENYSYNL